MTTNPHVITPTEAADLIETFASNKNGILDGDYKGDNILPDSESFDKESFDLLLASTTHYAGVRIYLGMDTDNNIRFVIKVIDENGDDVNNVILERGLRP